MRQTKLHEWHVRAGARMLEFGGWDMPVLYAAGLREEHLRVRAAAGLAAGRAHYSILCMESGGIIDDIFIYRLPDRWLMVVNASNAAKDLAWMRSQSKGFDVRVRDISPETCMIALQGLCSADLSSFAYHGVAECEVTGAPAALCSSGYTGEPGFEMLLPPARCRESWEAILAVRDSLRAEACPSLRSRDRRADRPVQRGPRGSGRAPGGPPFHRQDLPRAHRAGSARTAPGWFRNDRAERSPPGVRDHRCRPSGGARDNRSFQPQHRPLPRHGVCRGGSSGDRAGSGDRHQGRPEGRADRWPALLQISQLEVRHGLSF